MFVPAAVRHPDRVVNVGIREQLAISVTAGRPFEQLKIDVGHQGAGAALVSVGASYDWASGGRTHQAPGDVALIDTLPGWTVHVPGHPDDVDALLRSAVGADGPVYLRLSEQTRTPPHPWPAGGHHVVRRGERGTVVAVGPMLDRLLALGVDRQAEVRRYGTAATTTACTGWMRRGCGRASGASSLRLRPEAPVAALPAGHEPGLDSGRGGAMAEKDLRKGDHVTWNSHGGTAEGTVEEKITSDTKAAGRTVRASEDDPQYLVKSEKSGGQAVHKASALHEE